MEVSYNLRYTKSTFSNRLLIDKEGEIIIYAKGFRLKGKGANDKGELLNFSEIKEFYHRDEKIFFVTFSKEKYVLSDSGTLFDQMLIDFYKSRNEFLMDALFMKGGKLKAEFEGHFERLSKFSKPINKGRAKLRLYENSLLVIPATQDAFAINYNFVNFHEFDDMEYQLKIVMDDGVTVFFSQLGNDFEFFEEKMNTLLGGMYGAVVNGVLKEVFPEYHATTLLKLASVMKAGKSVCLKDIIKMDQELATSVDNFIFEDENLKDNFQFLRDKVDEYDLHFGIAKDETVENGFIRWFMISLVEENLVGFSILPRWESGGDSEDGDKPKVPSEMYFYRIIMEKGNPADKAADKIKEIEQALVLLKFAKDPCYMDKRELRHSPYQYAIRKMPFLRILRKSFVGKIRASEKSEWKKQFAKIAKSSKLK